MIDTQIYEHIVQTIRNLEPELTKLSQQVHSLTKIHSKPELSFQEHHAHDLLAEYMESHGFNVERKAFGLDTSFRAIFRNGTDGVRVGICSEYDALPGLGHACGHNLIAVLGVATALALKSALLEFGLNATIVLYGTPGEETTGGKILMLQNGAFQDVDVCMMAHPSNVNAKMGKWLALGVYQVEYFGKSAHAAASPQDGINALDACVLAYQSLGLVRIHAVILNGGDRPNIIPAYTKMEVYIRSDTIEQLLVLEEKVTNCFQGAGCTIKINKDPTFFNVKHNRALLESYSRYMEQQGEVFEAQDKDESETRGSTDMGNVSHHVPSMHPVFDIKCKEAYHTMKFCQQSATREAMQQTMKCAVSIASTGIECIEQKIPLNRYE